MTCKGEKETILIGKNIKIRQYLDIPFDAIPGLLWLDLIPSVIK